MQFAYEVVVILLILYLALAVFTFVMLFNNPELSLLERVEIAFKWPFLIQ